MIVLFIRRAKPRNADEIDSHGTRLLAEEIATGNLSIRKSSKIAAAFLKDGAKGLATRNLGSSDQARDFYRWIKTPCKPYQALRRQSTVGFMYLSLGMLDFIRRQSCRRPWFRCWPRINTKRQWSWIRSPHAP